MMMLSEVLERHAAEFPDDLAVIADDRRLNFADFAEQVRRAAAALHGSGVGPGDRVAFVGRNDPEFLFLSLAAMHVGAALVPINWRLAAPEVSYILGHSGARLLVVDEEFVGVIGQIRAEQPQLEQVVVLGASGTDLSYAQWAGSNVAPTPPSAATPEEIVYLMYTSGTTGNPKGAMITNANLDAALEITAESFGVYQRSTPMVSSPVFHIAGIAYALVGVWNAGTLVMVRNATPEALLSAIEDHGVTSSLLVPAMVSMMLQSPRARTTDLSSLERIAYGAAPISEDLLRRAIEFFKCDFVQAYGLTETTGVVVELPPEVHRADYPHPDRLRAAGVPLAGVQLQIRGADGASVPDGETGEVWIRTNQNIIGYWNDPAATAKALPGDQWFGSGDIGYLRDGFLYISDRLKDMIVTGGENVYSLEVENALMAHPDIIDCAVIGVPDDRWGEAVKAIVVTTEGAELDQTQVIEHCRRHLAGFKTPSSVDFVEILPRNGAGKILKRDLRQPYWSGMTRNVS